MGKLEGKVALVTGASSGIGAAVVRLFAQEGARVALMGRRRRPLAQLAEEVAADSLAVTVDVADPEAVAVAVATIDNSFGAIDIAVNCAGIVMARPLEALDAGIWQEVLAVNLSGAFYVAREAGLRMRARDGGAIVNIGSEFSVTARPSLVAYCASKAGLLGLTKALAIELAPSVRVNALCPGAVRTPMLEDSQKLLAENFDPTYAELRKHIPLGRIGEADEVAAAVLFLVADAPLATGAVLHLDGGTTI
jgi:NAD(P)-dependent dehydrogenase (short-subunit alcohol dehydrogenase family)